MKQNGFRVMSTTFMIAALSALLLACGNSSTNGSGDGETTAAATSNDSQSAAENTGHEEVAEADNTSETKNLKTGPGTKWKFQPIRSVSYITARLREIYWLSG